MKKVIIAAIILIGIVINIQAQQEKIIPGQYIVILNESASVPVMKRANRNFNRIPGADTVYRKQNIEKLKQVRNKLTIADSKVLNEFADLIVGFSAKLTDHEVSLLKNDKDIKAVYPDYIIKASDYKPGNESISKKPLTQTEACSVSMAGGAGDGSNKYTWIWILDTGIDLDHPDLNVEVYAPYAISYTGEPVDDQNGHGTHVAGIAAAKNNDFGVVGVSAGAKVVPVKVLTNAGPGEFSWLVAGLNHVAQFGIPGDVVNMSLGVFSLTPCDQFSPILNASIINLGNIGIWIVMAAGNDASNATFSHPGCLNGDRIFTVGAIDCANVCAPFSNFGSNVDYVTGGVNILSTSKNGTYEVLSGTSMSAPVLSGILHQINTYPHSYNSVFCSGATYKIPTRN